MLQLRNLVSVAFVSLAMAACNAGKPQALVYHDSSISPGLSESVQELLETSPRNFNVTIVGPEEDVDITPELLNNVTIIAFPGGPGSSPFLDWDLIGC